MLFVPEASLTHCWHENCSTNHKRDHAGIKCLVDFSRCPVLICNRPRELRNPCRRPQNKGLDALLATQDNPGMATILNRLASYLGIILYLKIYPNMVRLSLKCLIIYSVCNMHHELPGPSPLKDAANNGRRLNHHRYL